MDRYLYHEYTILLGATRALAHIGVYFIHCVFRLSTNKRPYFSYMKIWGSPAYVKRTILDKLEAKSDKCLFVGYPKETMGYQFYNTLEQRLFVS